MTPRTAWPWSIGLTTLRTVNTVEPDLDALTVPTHHDGIPVNHTDAETVPRLTADGGSAEQEQARDEQEKFFHQMS